MTVLFQEIRLFLCLLIVDRTLVRGQTCDTGWFGSQCQYKCHCTNDRCNNNGDCREGSTCERGWFGPACQYVDLMSATHEGKSLLENGDDVSCNKQSNVHDVRFQFNFHFHFTWLRIQVNDPVLFYNFSLQFRSRNVTDPLECEDMRTAVVSQNMLDIHCRVSATVYQVTLTGEGVTSLCSLYISGGRNVALRQKATQSSTASYYITMAEAPLAVDGNTDGNLPNGSCTHTEERDPSPSWSVLFSKPQKVNRYVLYNRKDCCGWRILGFVITGFANNGTQVFKYKHYGRDYQNIYMVNDEKISTLSKLLITVSDNGDRILSLCEVKMFGDSACQSGRYGRECEHTCNCAVKTESCFVSTGGCPSGCAAGYYGEDCQQVLDKINPSGGDNPDNVPKVILGVGVGFSAFFLVATMIVIGVCCYRRLRSKAGHVRPPGYDVAVTSRQDNHSYRIFNAPRDDYVTPTSRQGEQSYQTELQSADGYITPTDPAYSTSRQDALNCGTNDQSNNGYITPIDPPAHMYYTEIIDDNSLSRHSTTGRRQSTDTNLYEQVDGT